MVLEIGDDRRIVGLRRRAARRQPNRAEKQREGTA